MLVRGVRSAWLRLRRRLVEPRGARVGDARWLAALSRARNDDAPRGPGAAQREARAAYALEPRRARAHRPTASLRAPRALLQP